MDRTFAYQFALAYRSPGCPGKSTGKLRTGSVALAAIDVEDMPGDEGSFIRRDKDDGIGDLLRQAEAIHRNSRHESRLVLRRVRKTGQHSGIYRTRRHAVHTNSRLDRLKRHCVGEPFDGVLAADIDRGPSRTLVPVG